MSFKGNFKHETPSIRARTGADTSLPWAQDSVHFGVKMQPLRLSNLKAVKLRGLQDFCYLCKVEMELPPLLSLYTPTGVKLPTLLCPTCKMQLANLPK